MYYKNHHTHRNQIYHVLYFQDRIGIGVSTILVLSVTILIQARVAYPSNTIPVVKLIGSGNSKTNTAARVELNLSKIYMILVDIYITTMNDEEECEGVRNAECRMRSAQAVRPSPNYRKRHSRQGSDDSVENRKLKNKKRSEKSLFQTKKDKSPICM